MATLGLPVAAGHGSHILRAMVKTASMWYGHTSHSGNPNMISDKQIQ